MEYEGDGDTNCHWYPPYNHQRIVKRALRLGNMRMSGVNAKYSIIFSARIWRRVQKNTVDLLSLRLQLKTISYRWSEK